MGRVKDRAGEVCGDYTVLSFACQSKNGTSKWLCQCPCGKEKVIFTTVLTRNGGPLCPCKSAAKQAAAKTTHGMTETPTWNSWHSMRLRCENPNAPDYPDYGGRGITICERWASFENFLEDMGVRPEGKTLDRIENMGNYERDNCKWSTPKEQANNRRPRKNPCSTN